MNLTGLWLNNFRSYDRLYLPLTPNLTVLVGNNAQGKTNLLEAIFFCCTARSHRTNKEKELIKWDCERAYIKTEAERGDGKHRVEISISKHKKKCISVNALPIKRVGELLGHMHCVMFSPEDLMLVKAGPAERRRFIDIEVSQVRKPYFYALANYISTLDQRNRLLKSLQFSGSLLGTLDVWDEQLADSGAKIIMYRSEFIERLKPIAQEVHSHISSGQEVLSLAYSTQIEHESIESAKAGLLEKFKAKREDDISRGTTTAGPHRDDLAVFVNGVDLRAFGSQGQQRTAALSLKLSELELFKQYTGEYPVLLLDDVLSELDPDRQAMLLDNISGKQTIITCADFDEALLERFYGCSVYQVSNSHLEKVRG